MNNCPPYVLKKTQDCRSAVTTALALRLREVQFSLPKTTVPFKFAAVYDTWASYSDTASSSGGKLPAAAVLPDRPVYSDAALTPRLLEETWSGGPVRPGTLGDGSGRGWALFEIAQMTVPLVLLVRAESKPMRRAIVSQLEDLFVQDGSLPDRGSVNQTTTPEYHPYPPEEYMRMRPVTLPIRYGLLVNMPTYYQRRVRFTLVAQQLLDSPQNAIENRWEAQFELEAHTQVCVARQVHAMCPKVRLTVDGEVAGR